VERRHPDVWTDDRELPRFHGCAWRSAFEFPVGSTVEKTLPFDNIYDARCNLRDHWLTSLTHLLRFDEDVAKQALHSAYDSQIDGGRHWLSSIGSHSAADVSGWLMLRVCAFQAGIKKIVNSFPDARLDEPCHVLSDSIVCWLL